MLLCTLNIELKLNSVVEPSLPSTKFTFSTLKRSIKGTSFRRIYAALLLALGLGGNSPIPSIMCGSLLGLSDLQNIGINVSSLMPDLQTGQVRWLLSQLSQ